ncbi:YcaO-like family protein [Dactylosporangium sp. NPDC005572]|uniref:YcaO-like family protein n=1 Tax=Dactylosporangium sp. NPDC005572 TaxID=3156889 RepID=UPI00339DC1AE
MSPSTAGSRCRTSVATTAATSSPTAYAAPPSANCAPRASPHSTPDQFSCSPPTSTTANGSRSPRSPTTWNWSGPPGTRLSTGHLILVPAQLVWISYAHAAPLRGVPFIGPAHAAGLAAGDGIDHAHWSALCQLIERAAVTVGWHGRRPLRQVRPPHWLVRLAAGTDGRLRTRFVEFPNEFGLTVIGAVVGDDDDRYLIMGAAARAGTVPAMLKALAEAFQLRVFVADLDNPDGPYLRTAHEPGSPFLPWRADRRYLDDRRADLADVVEHCTHLQLYLDPRMRRRFATELDDAVTATVDWRDLDQAPDQVTDNDLTDLVARLDRHRHTPVSVDVARRRAPQRPARRPRPLHQHLRRTAVARRHPPARRTHPRRRPP